MDLCLVNPPLLGKRRWRIISRVPTLGHDILTTRYRYEMALSYLGGKVYRCLGHVRILPRFGPLGELPLVACNRITTSFWNDNCME